MLDTYQINLAGLLLACGALLAVRSTPSSSEKKDAKPKASTSKGQTSQWAFFIVYALVMGSDWLQGPFLYSLYKDQHALPPSLIPRLFTTGFLSGALTAPFIGSLADRHGRRSACLVFCVASAASCLLTAYPPSSAAGTPSIPALFLGRVLGGLSTSLLFSVFETWMVTDFGNRRLAANGADLSRTFGLLSTVNSIVAIMSGVASESLVGMAGTTTAPFAASVALVAAAALVISTQWDENYGSAGQVTGAKVEKKTKTAAGPSLRDTLTSRGVLAVALSTTTFEGSMYLFVVLWAPVLQSASATPADLPYGLIFAAFMSATLLSSLLYQRLSRYGSPAAVLGAILALASAVLLILSTSSGKGGGIGEQRAFWLFCAFEAAVGAYFPAAGVLKGDVVPDGVRGQVYAALRVPLNAFVVLSLILMGEGTATAATTVFGVCGALLLGGAGAVWLVAR